MLFHEKLTALNQAVIAECNRWLAGDQEYLELQMSTIELSEGFVTEVHFGNLKIAEFHGPYQKQFGRRLVGITLPEASDADI